MAENSNQLELKQIIYSMLIDCCHCAFCRGKVRGLYHPQEIRFSKQLLYLSDAVVFHTLWISSCIATARE
ncbi:hypothetical protein [Photorhabdus bodei]|uniref:Uncharacterized protein n=2 Tax=Photorhabdus bodei TaxID=2029681 RepID=A0AAW6BGR7_9GAMM|nr:hypothetical protein [Photorhabdus bodei]MDB6372673.1 hypothetical protein [Photorhabdus bodei]